MKNIDKDFNMKYRLRYLVQREQIEQLTNENKLLKEVLIKIIESDDKYVELKDMYFKGE